MQRLVGFSKIFFQVHWKSTLGLKVVAVRGVKNVYLFFIFIFYIL